MFAWQGEVEGTNQERGVICWEREINMNVVILGSKEIT